MIFLEKLRPFFETRTHSKRRFFILGTGILASILFLGCGLWLTPSPELVRRRALGSDRVLLAAHGEVLQTLRTDYKKRRLGWHDLSQFPESLQSMVIAVEDQRFYHHWGVDPWGLGRAFFALIKGQRLQGASTITMQLTDLIQPKVLTGVEKINKGTLFHKILQIGRAFFLEMRWQKPQIMEAYLNLIHLRGELQGVPAYSYAYLHRHPLAIEEADAFVVAAQIASPNLGKQKLYERACRLLKSRAFLPSLSCEEVKINIEGLLEQPPRIPMGPSAAPHLAQRIFHDFPNENWLTTTIDARLQQRVSQILSDNVMRLQSSKVRDSAAIVIENKTGNVLAYVGAVPTSASPHVDGVRAYRQAGSALKPFLYAKAIDSKTVTAASILLDDPTALSWNGQVYRPTNYDKQFNGPVSVREALASSLNVPAVKIVTIIGLHETYKTLQDIGITNLKEPDFYGVSMALGAVEVRLEDLTNAYRIFANQGVWQPLTWLAPPTAPSEPERRVFSTEASYILSSILSDPNARAIGFGWESPLDTPFWTAVKTGTSKDYRDNWCVGFSEDYTVGVWAGNFDATAMENVSGVTGAGPSWYAIMQELHRERPSAKPQRPEGVVTKTVKHAWASQEIKEYFIRGTEPSQSEIEAANDKQVQFIYPADGSVLIEDPHLDPSLIALSIRFKGQVPEGSLLFWDDRPLGAAVSPHIMSQPPVGAHALSIRGPDGKTLAQVHFAVKGPPPSPAPK